MMNWDDPRHLTSLVGGLILLATGGIPLLNQAGVIPFGLPGFLTSVIGSIAVYVIALAALLIFVFGMMEQSATQKLSLLIGLVLLGLALIPILNQFGVIGFSLPFNVFGLFYTYIIFVVEGLLLLMAFFEMF